MGETRNNSVRILEEDFSDTGKLDNNRRPIVHAFIVERVGDGVVLAKYRATETVMVTKEVKNPKTGAVTLKNEETEISGEEAAKRACITNGWKIARN